ncbi:MAG TPA: hypothetical protein PKW80_12415 [Bacteroidales bacterium]|nr:hypothetical protein [Bacteroidales bacterium]
MKIKYWGEVALTLLGLLFCGLSCFSQIIDDAIITKNKDTIWCKILFFRNNNIFYTTQTTFKTQTDSINLAVVKSYMFNQEHKPKKIQRTVLVVTPEERLRRKMDSIRESKTMNNSFFVELLGNAPVYSFNYERKVFNRKFLTVAVRTGVSYMKWYGFGDDIFDYHLNMATLFKLYKRIYFELGSGAAYITERYFDEYYHRETKFYIDYVCIAGLRIQNYNGFQWRLCFTPRFRSYDGRYLFGRPWGGISMGYSF